MNNALPSSTSSTPLLPSSHSLPPSSPSPSSFSSSTPSPVQSAIPFIIPFFYHCDLVRDYNTHKRISKRNQENNNDDISIENSQYRNTSIISQKCNSIKNNALNLSSPIHNKKILIQNENENENENEEDSGKKNQSNFNEILSLNQSIQISSISTSSSSLSMNNKMDTSSEKFTLKYLREIGYTPDRIRTEILDLTSEFIY